MKTWLHSLVIALHVLPSFTLLVKSPEKTSQSLLEQTQDLRRGKKLNPAKAKRQWLEKKRQMRIWLLANEKPDEDPLPEDAMDDVPEDMDEFGRGPKYHDEEAQKASGKALERAHKNSREPFEDSTEDAEVAAEEVEESAGEVGEEVGIASHAGTKKKEKKEKKGKKDKKESSKEKEEEEVECIVCNGVQVVYGKYRSIDGSDIDNSYYLFKDPAAEESNETLPVAIQFHPGGFFSGGPWRTENKEIKAYLKMGFAVVSVGYRLTTEKYFYNENETEELINVTADGKLSLDAGATMDDYDVQVGKQEFITKYLYDATQMMENLIHESDKYGLDVHRIVFIGESSGGAAIQYLTWVYHQWNKDRYTPRGIVYHNGQLNYPVNNMLDKVWDLFAETMGANVKLSDVVSEEACPSIVGNPMCGSALGNLSDYNLCNEEWNERTLKEFCGEAIDTATLGQAQKRQVWNERNGEGYEKLWYASENMKTHMPADPFYIYVANSMNGTSAIDVAHHSIFALNFAKYAEMGQDGGHQYTVYYTDFAHMSEEDQGTKRLDVEMAPTSLHVAAPPVPASPAAVLPVLEMSAPGPAPRSPAPAPGPAPEFAVATNVVFNYLSTHGWREDVAEAREIQAASLEERVLYACLAVGIGPFAELKNETKVESGTIANVLPTFSLIAALIGFFCNI